MVCHRRYSTRPGITQAASAFILVVLLAVTGCRTTTANLDDLLERYIEHDLPLVPEDAVLCTSGSTGISIVNGKRVYPTSIVFALEHPTPGEQVECIAGTTGWLSHQGEILMPIAPSVRNVRDTTPCFTSGRPFDMSIDLGLAMQCKAIGMDRIANYICRRNPTLQWSRQDVDYLAWQYWSCQFPKEPGDRRQIVDRLKALSSLPDLNTKWHTKLVADMEATIAPRRQTDDEIEELIEALIDYSHEGGFFSDIPRDAPRKQLMRKGFNAVEALIAHYEDHRLTRTIISGFNNFPSRHERISDTAMSILQGLMCNDGGDFFQPRKGEVVAWWARVKNVDEESYLLAHVLSREDKSEWVNSIILMVIAAKYPQRLPETYRKVLELHTRVCSGSTVDEIVNSSLPRQTKIETLLKGVRSDRLSHKRAALIGLRDLGYDDYISVLTEAVEYLPERPQEPYWLDPGHFAVLVAQTDSDEAWTTLTMTAKRVDVGTRMEFIGNMMHCNVFDKHHERRVAFLRRFLEDTDVRDCNADPDMFSGPCAGSVHDRIVVGDFAALKLAYTLGLDVNENPEWTAKDWRKLKQKVYAALNTPQ